MSALKVMIVDDEKHVRESLQQTLTLEDFDIEACESAQEALKIIEANWEGIVITDINICLLYTSPSPRDRQKSRMPSSA